MDIKAIIGAIFLSLFSTCVMSYLAIAMPIGPWIAPTLVLIAFVLSKCLRTTLSQRSLICMTAAGSVGGIIATAFGFSFPTLYFLDHALFEQLVATPYSFVVLLGLLSLAGALFGVFVANLYETTMLADEQMTFPIGQLVHTMITAGNQIKNMYQLVSGFLATTVFCVLQDGAWIIPSVLPKSLILLPRMQYGFLQIPSLIFDVWPMLWAIGFITGHLIALPLAIGAFSKIFFVDTVHILFFSTLTPIVFQFSFLSGMVLCSMIHGFWDFPRLAKKIYHDWVTNHHNKLSTPHTFSRSVIVEQLLLLCIVVVCLHKLHFNIIEQCYLLITTLLFTHQMILIGGKWGIAPLGRFATFVMVPAMVLFSLRGMAVVLVATFVEIAGGSAVDIFFGRKMAQLGNISLRTIRWYQYMGIIISSIAVGCFFWVLMTTMEVGSSQLFAYKAQSRYLLINALTNTADFSLAALGLGVLFCVLLQLMKINPMLVLGGLLMPLNLSIGLITGALLRMGLRNRPSLESFWSGVFASNSVWMIIRTLW